MKYLLLILSIFSFTSISSQDLIPLKKGDKYAFFLNEQRVTDFVYDAVSAPSPSGYIVQANGVQGMINHHGEEVIPLQYDYLVVAGDNAIIASQDQLAGVLDTLGQDILPFIYERIDQYSSSGTAVVKQNGKWGVLRNGNLSQDISKVVFKHPETIPLFVGSHKQRKSLQEKHQRSYTKLTEFVLTEYLNSETVIKNRIGGSAVLAFVVTPQGKVRSPWVEASTDNAFSQVLLKIAKKMPEWSAPPMVDGVPVSMEFKLPVELTLHQK